MKKLALLGTGFLGGIIARAWKEGLLPGYTLVGVTGRNREKTAALAREADCPAFSGLEELLKNAHPDIVAECAGVQAVKDHAEAILSSGADLVTLSIGAFADAEFYTHIAEVARASGSTVHIASGAVGGFDVARTIALMGRASGTGGKGRIDTRKGPKSLQGTPLYTDDLPQSERTVFTGNAKEAIALLPTKVNVAVAASLACSTPGETEVSITSVPGFVGDDHCITVEGGDARATVDIYSATSAIAAWSVVARLNNLVSPIQF